MAKSNPKSGVEHRYDAKWNIPSPSSRTPLTKKVSISQSNSNSKKVPTRREELSPLSAAEAESRLANASQAISNIKKVIQQREESSSRRSKETLLRTTSAHHPISDPGRIATNRDEKKSSKEGPLRTTSTPHTINKARTPSLPPRNLKDTPSRMTPAQQVRGQESDTPILRHPKKVITRTNSAPQRDDGSPNRYKFEEEEEEDSTLTSPQKRRIRAASYPYVSNDFTPERGSTAREQFVNNEDNFAAPSLDDMPDPEGLTVRQALDECSRVLQKLQIVAFGAEARMANLKEELLEMRAQLEQMFLEMPTDCIEVREAWIERMRRIMDLESQVAEQRALLQVYKNQVVEHTNSQKELEELEQLYKMRIDFLKQKMDKDPDFDWTIGETQDTTSKEHQVPKEDDKIPMPDKSFTATKLAMAGMNLGDVTASEIKQGMASMNLKNYDLGNVSPTAIRRTMADMNMEGQGQAKGSQNATRQARTNMNSRDISEAKIQGDEPVRDSRDERYVGTIKKVITKKPSKAYSKTGYL